MRLDASRIGSHGVGETAAGFVAAPCHSMAETLREKQPHIAAVCAPMKDGATKGADDVQTEHATALMKQADDVQMEQADDVQTERRRGR